MKKVSTSPLLILIVFLCYKCFFKNPHDKKHLIIDIDDEESLEESDISYEKTVSEFDKIFKKTKNIKDRIEEEIEEINNLHKKIMDEITASFKEQHIKLNNEENELKSDLDMKVTKAKNQLENFLLESMNILTSCERAEKANKYYEKKNDNNKIKTLYYITKIIKLNEKSKELFQKPIKNLDIYFNSDLNNIDYKEYYFSGIPIPKNIKAEEKGNKVYISWDIDDFRIKNFDINNIKYKIEIKGANKTSTYESLETNLILQDYQLNIEYEIKIKCEIDDYFGKWSQIENFTIENKGNEEKSVFNPFNNINQGGGLFNNNNLGGGLFGNNNQGGGLFGNNNQGGSLFGKEYQGGNIFNFKK